MDDISRLIWDETREYEMGLDRAVFYPPSGPGEAWNGLVSVSEELEETDAKVRYFDGLRTNQRRRTGQFAGTIEAYTYPPSFYTDILTQRRQKTFGMSYRTGKGASDYKIHIVYNVTLLPSAFSYEQNDVGTYEWDFSTLPTTVPGAKSSAHLIIDTSIAYSWTVAALEDLLYGTSLTSSSLPTPTEVLQLFEDNALLQIIDNGDGTWTAISDSPLILDASDPDEFTINWPSVTLVDADTFTVYSL